MISHTASWHDVTLPKYEPLSEVLSTDVVIIGGGITGLTAAYLLAKAGKRVVLLEADRLAYGATGATTGFLAHVVDTSLTEMGDMFGWEKTGAIVESHRAATALVEQIIKEEGINCEFKRVPNYIFANSPKHVDELRQEAESAATLKLPHHLSSDPAILPFKNEGSLMFENQGMFHPLRYLQTITTKASEYGAVIFEQTPVLNVKENKDGVTVTTKQGTVTGTHVLMATYLPINRKLFFKKALYKSYVMELSIPNHALPTALYEDMNIPYHYFRVEEREGSARLIIGGEDHRADIPVNPAKNFQALTAYTDQLLANIPHTIIRQWSGPIAESIDGLAYVGPTKNSRISYATGFSGNGMTYSMIAAVAFRDAVEGKTHPWTTLYSADRWPTLRQLKHKGIDYSKELIGGAIKNTFTYTGKPTE